MDPHETERPPLCRDRKRSAIVDELWPGGPPRLFALVQEDEDEHEEVVRQVTAYGIELPGGEAATVGAVHGWGRWLSADSASEWTGSDLVWLST
jgi:hypothetical protein